jgi:hypothetical protein
MDYANGKIYKITGGGMTYYGSTTQALSKRMYTHKQLKYSRCSSKIIIETGEAVIVLVELFPCKSKEELFSRERWFIENNECVNKCIPNRTHKEYYIDNKDKINERHNQYYIDNKDKVNEINKQNYIANKDKINERHKKYNTDNKDKMKEYMKKYRLHKKEQNNNL